METLLENLRKTFDEKSKIRTAILDQLKTLEQNEKVKMYIELSNNNTRLHEELTELAWKIKEEEMKTCNHIWFMSFFDRTLRYAHYTCVKCGLDTYAKERVRMLRRPTRLDEIMDKLVKPYFDNVPGIRTDIECDSRLARGIYDCIVATHHDITDEQIIKYLNTALHNIRNKKVTEHVKIKRIERLRLPQTFNSWNEEDIHK